METERDGLPLEREIDRKSKRLRVTLESATRMPPSKVTLDDEVDDLDGISSTLWYSVGLTAAS